MGWGGVAWDGVGWGDVDVDVDVEWSGVGWAGGTCLLRSKDRPHGQRSKPDLHRFRMSVDEVRQKVKISRMVYLGRTNVGTLGIKCQSLGLSELGIVLGHVQVVREKRNPSRGPLWSFLFWFCEFWVLLKGSN